MTKNCFVIISGHSDAPDIKGYGRYHRKDSGHYVFMEREQDGVTEKISLRFGADHFSYKRDGQVKTEVLLEPGRVHTSIFATPYGRFEIGFETRDLLVTESDDKIEIGASYRMTLNGEPHEEGNIRILITEVKA